MSDNEREMLAVTASTSSVQPEVRSGDRLVVLSTAQEEKTNTWLKKMYELVRLVVFRGKNELESFVLSTEPNDCSLVAKYSEIVDVDLSSQPTLSVNSVTLNTLHIPHPLINFIRNEENKQVYEELNLDNELEQSPVLLFIHGLGGQMSQFEPLMGLLSQCSEIYALDLPGFGNSKLHFNNNKSVSVISDADKQRISSSIAKMKWEDFVTDNIVNIIYEFVMQNIPENKKILIIGHSMGTHLSIKLSKKLPNHKVEGLILLSMPKLFDDSQMQVTQQPKGKVSSILYFFTFFPKFFNIFRCWDRIRGLRSQSVLRQMSEGQQNIYNKLRQFRWNMDVDSEIVLKYVYGFTLAKYSDIVQAISQFNDNPNDTRTYEKTLLVCGKEDVLTPYKYNEAADEYLTKTFNRKVNHLIGINNAGHSIFFAKPEFICGKILDHIENKFPERLHLSPSWVLKVKAQISGDKWGLKNELKWSKLKPLSSNITRNNSSDIAPLVAMKTLREDDSGHSPKILESLFYGSDEERSKLPDDTKGNLIAIIDISSDAPPYSPKSFNRITYYKQATVSKVVPDQIAIRKFIQLVDEILKNNTVDNPLIAVHCHYGFNRTGFLICCYLIERLGWGVKDAVEGFKAAKPPGIKHPHFIDALYVRYER